MKQPYKTPDGVVKLFEVAEDGTGAPPSPWTPVAEAPSSPAGDPELGGLVAEAERLSIKVDKRWSKATLFEKIAEKMAEQARGDDSA